MSDVREQAGYQFESIKEMVAALEVDYNRLSELNERVDDEDDPLSEDEQQELNYLKDAAGECEDEYQARERIDQDPLCVEVRSDWHSPGHDSEAGEYTILLCTGGPACRIIGNLSDYKEPESARIEYQDRFTPWENYHLDSEQEEVVLTYASQFWYGE